MKQIQENKRNDAFQSLTIALDNQNQLDKINQGNFDFGQDNYSMYGVTIQANKRYLNNTFYLFYINYVYFYY